MQVCFVHDSRRYPSDAKALSIWLDLAAGQANQVHCQPFDRGALAELLPELRSLSRLTPREFLPELVGRCANVGVGVVVVPGIERCRVSSAAAMLSPCKAILALSIRYKRDDHFWFSFFAAAASLLGQGEPCSVAADILIPPQAAGELASLTDEPRIKAFAERLGIADGIVAGRLQHDGLTPWHHLNHLKREVDLEWVLEALGAMCGTWQTVSDSAQQLLDDVSRLKLAEARARVSIASVRGAFISNGQSRYQRRIEPVSFAAWRLQQRLRDIALKEATDALPEAQAPQSPSAAPMQGAWVMHVNQLADRAQGLAQVLVETIGYSPQQAHAAIRRGEIAAGDLQEMRSLQQRIQQGCGIRPALLRRTEAA